MKEKRCHSERYSAPVQLPDMIAVRTRSLVGSATERLWPQRFRAWRSWWAVVPACREIRIGIVGVVLGVQTKDD